VIVSP